MTHTKDSDCTVGSDDLCTECGVDHGDECGACGGRGFHRLSCPYPTDEPKCGLCGVFGCEALPKVGEFIEIPAWKTFGMVHEISPAMFGGDHSVNITLEEEPGQREPMRVFRLEPGQFTIDG